MIDKDKLPGNTYSELIELLGYESAEAFLKKVNYNYYSINLKIIEEKIKRKYNKKKRILAFIVILIIVIIYEILNHYLII